MQHHTLTVEECHGNKCTTEVVNVHDTAMLDEQKRLKSLQAGVAKTPVMPSDLRLESVTIQKQVGRPLVVTVKQDESDPGQQVQSGGALLTDDAKSRVASANQAAALDLADPKSAQKAAEVAQELGKHGAAAHHEGDNVLDIHRDDIDLSPTLVDPVSVNAQTNITDDNNLQIMQDTNSSSLLSGFNSDKGREAQQRQQQQLQQEDTAKLDVDSQPYTGVRLGTAKRHVLSGRAREDIVTAQKLGHA